MAIKIKNHGTIHTNGVNAYSVTILKGNPEASVIVKLAVRINRIKNKIPVDGLLRNNCLKFKDSMSGFLKKRLRSLSVIVPMTKQGNVKRRAINIRSYKS